MIREEELVRIGRFTKPHGIKGEIALALDIDIFNQVDCPYLICCIDGIYVPFFVQEYRRKGENTVLIIFEDSTSDVSAKFFQGLDVYYPLELFDAIDEIEYSLDYFVGFRVSDEKLGNIGIIRDVDDSTVNILFLIEREDASEVIVPASDDFILNVDADKRVLYMNLPEGLF